MAGDQHICPRPFYTALDAQTLRSELPAGIDILDDSHRLLEVDEHTLVLAVFFSVKVLQTLQCTTPQESSGCICEWGVCGQ
jgi:hypothetical protein